MYQVLYRKYRPKVFDDVCGQDYIVTTLKNEIKQNRISHAYLFTGSRGTGKTTCAKIFAKAVNCENSVDGEPCGECEVCKAIDSGSIYDVVEMDAASNRRIDDIRNIIEDVNYTPIKGKYKVYIVDEVHMLTQEAFNALLKTLEEPPEHLIFILATTEVQKLPATIVSRCQRFDFKRIQPEVMAPRLTQIAQLEGIELTESAAMLIARIADGALRDGISILDQCSGFGKKIDTDVVSEIAGIASNDSLYRLAQCIAESDFPSAMSEISYLHQYSFDMERLCVEMINLFRNLLVVKTVKKNRDFIICTDTEYDTICKCADSFTTESIYYSLDIMQSTLANIKSGAVARTEVEMAFVRLCSPKLDDSSTALVERISKLERSLEKGIAIQNTDNFADKIIPEREKVTEPAPDYTAQKENKPKIEPKKETETAKPVQAESYAESEKPTETAETAETAEPPKPIFEDKGDSSQSSEKAKSQTDVPAEPTDRQGSPNSVRFEQWNEFMDIIHKNAIALYGVLTDAKAYIRGDFFLIDSPNPAVKEFIKVPTSAKAIKQAVFEVTGKNYKLGILKHDENAKKDDALEKLVNYAEKNIKINFEN